MKKASMAVSGPRAYWRSFVSGEGSVLVVIIRREEVEGGREDQMSGSQTASV